MMMVEYLSMQDILIWGGGQQILTNAWCRDLSDSVSTVFFFNPGVINFFFNLRVHTHNASFSENMPGGRGRR